jgi:phytoene dehydrogenase-like protein
MSDGSMDGQELYEGFKFSRASYLFSLFRPTIVDELQLKEHGLRFYHRHPSSFTPLHDGRYLMLGSDSQWNRQEIAKFRYLTYIIPDMT